MGSVSVVGGAWVRVWGGGGAGKMGAGGRGGRRIADNWCTTGRGRREEEEGWRRGGGSRTLVIVGGKERNPPPRRFMGVKEFLEILLQYITVLVLLYCMCRFFFETRSVLYLYFQRAFGLKLRCQVSPQFPMLHTKAC
jgi:hypothetical protein